MKLSVLQGIVRREARSLIQYVGDAYPWTSSQGREALGTIQEVIESEKKALADLTQHMFRLRIPQPYPGSYPTRFTTMNFISLHHLVPLLLAEEDRLITALQEDLQQLPEGDESRAVVEQLLSLKRANVEKLQQLPATSLEPAIKD